MADRSSIAPPRPPSRTGDKVRVVGAAIGGAAGAIIGRMLDKSETIYVATPRNIPGAPPSHGAVLMFAVRF